MPRCLPSPVLSRRELLRIGGLGMAGMSLPNLLAAEESGAGRISARADACIVIFLNGGPSHLDMWDMKPAAPADIRGEFQPIATSAPGVQVCEHLPRLAQQMHRCALVRSMRHTVNNAHALAVYTAMTGHDRGDANRIVASSADDQPAPGAVLARLRPARRDVVAHAALPYKTKEGAGGPPQPGFFGGWLGRAYDPLWILKDPNAGDFSVPEFSLRGGITTERLAQRGSLLSQINGQIGARREGVAAASAMSDFQFRALDMLTSRATQQAFRIDREKAAVRDSYGRNIYGQSVLLARRMIEAGTRLVTVSWAPDANATWDTHAGNFKKLKDPLLPQFDAACSALIDDLAERGMLERTLIAVLGDFGRTPKINKNDAGRDHWNYCYTVLLCGGGVRPGYIHGASDKTGAFPDGDAATPADLLATLYRLLGVDHRRVLHDREGRPHQIIKDGSVVDALVG